jgi:hypothetical protein
MMSPNGSGGDRITADALNRFWDELGSAHPGGPARPEERLDPNLTRSVRRLRQVDEAPRPEPAFAARLWADLMTTPAPAAPAPASSPAPSGLAGSLSRWPRHRVLVELTVAAALLLMVLGGGTAFNLPGAFDASAPTSAASAAAPGYAAIASGCNHTVTPEPTQAAIATGALSTAPPAATIAYATLPTDC